MEGSGKQGQISKIQILKIPSFDYSRTWSFYDGASHKAQLYAALELRFTIPSEPFHLKLGVGAGSNSKAELLALWLVLFLERGKILLGFKSQEIQKL